MDMSTPPWFPGEPPAGPPPGPPLGPPPGPPPGPRSQPKSLHEQPTQARSRPEPPVDPGYPLRQEIPVAAPPSSGTRNTMLVILAVVAVVVLAIFGIWMATRPGHNCNTVSSSTGLATSSSISATTSSTTT